MDEEESLPQNVKRLQIVGKTNVNVNELRVKNQNQSLKLQNKGITMKLNCLYSKYEHFKHTKYTKLSQLKSVNSLLCNITRAFQQTESAKVSDIPKCKFISM